jgi:hypothetical protein
MRKLSLVAVLALLAFAADARAIEIKNVRSTYGPFGNPRPNNKILPGDVYLIYFDITDLKPDPKTGAVEYTLTQEVFDPKGKQLVPDKDKSYKKGLILGLGGTTAPEFTHVVIGLDKDPGKYKVVITIEEKSTKAKATATHEIDVQPQDFGFIFVMAPATGFVAQDYAAEFTLVGWQRDTKTKAPKITLTTRIIDDATGKPTQSQPMVSNIPADLNSDIKWEKEQVIRMTSPIFLNRAGSFTVEIEAKDELAKNKTVKLTYKVNSIPPAK